MSTAICEIGPCTHVGGFRVLNNSTGKVWIMCEWHKAAYVRNEGTPMIVIERLETN